MRELGLEHTLHVSVIVQNRGCPNNMMQHQRCDTCHESGLCVDA